MKLFKIKVLTSYRRWKDGKTIRGNELTVYVNPLLIESVYLCGEDCRVTMSSGKWYITILPINIFVEELNNELANVV